MIAVTSNKLKKSIINKVKFQFVILTVIASDP
jgi:hypothetical protein